MSRAVTADHVMFNECISVFRPEKLEINIEKKELVGYLLLDFSLQTQLEFAYFSIKPTIEVQMPGAYAAFIAPVILPKWFELNHNEHLFTIALSAVVSFITGRSIKAPRDGYTSGSQQLDENTVHELAIQHPILAAGPGSHDTRISLATTAEIKSQLEEAIQLLFNLPYDLYITLMQSIRLIHLAHINKREEFGLGYYLLVSAIEPIATLAIKRKIVAPQHDLLQQWKISAKTDLLFNQLFTEYKQELGKNKYIGKRFVEFVMKYCPPSQWQELEHPSENINSYIKEFTAEFHDWSWTTKKQWYEIYPEDLTEDQIRGMLIDCYNYRSKFTHEGKSPPYRTPDSHNRFFDKETIVDYDEKTEELKSIYDVVLPNFRLISFIAKKSILNYFKDRLEILCESTSPV